MKTLQLLLALSIICFTGISAMNLPAYNKNAINIADLSPHDKAALTAAQELVRETKQDLRQATARYRRASGLHKLSHAREDAQFEFGCASDIHAEAIESLDRLETDLHKKKNNVVISPQTK